MSDESEKKPELPRPPAGQPDWTDAEMLAMQRRKQAAEDAGLADVRMLVLAHEGYKYAGTEAGGIRGPATMPRVPAPQTRAEEPIPPGPPWFDGLPGVAAWASHPVTRDLLRRVIALENDAKIHRRGTQEGAFDTIANAIQQAIDFATPQPKVPPQDDTRISWTPEHVCALPSPAFTKDWTCRVCGSLWVVKPDGRWAGAPRTAAPPPKSDVFAVAGPPIPVDEAPVCGEISPSGQFVACAKARCLAPSPGRHWACARSYGHGGEIHSAGAANWPIAPRDVKPGLLSRETIGLAIIKGMRARGAGVYLKAGGGFEGLHAQVVGQAAIEVLAFGELGAELAALKKMADVAQAALPKDDGRDAAFFEHGFRAAIARFLIGASVDADPYVARIPGIVAAELKKAGL